MTFSNQPIRRKLAIVTLGATVFALLLASIGFSVYERSNFRAAVVSELSTLADTLGANESASLTFRDQKTAEEILTALRAEQQVLAACLYDEHGQSFARYRRADLPADFPLPALQAEGAYFGPRSFTLVRGVSLAGEPVGFIVITSDLIGFQAKLREYARIVIVVLVLSILTTTLASSRLLAIVSRPIVHLAEVAGRVSAEQDYSLRAIAYNQDESGKLVQSFNQMLEGIQQRDLALQKARDELEVRVLERTSELEKEVLERKQAEAEMRRARDAAEIANRAKSEFLANMSHEIRTPLNGVIGMTELALDCELTDELREHLETIELSANTLLTVINDILDFSKIEAGKIELEATDFNLRDSVEETLKTLAIRADKKGLELLCDIAAEVPEWVTGDPLRLRQILLNLVGNAIKFTERGEVAVRVTMAAVAGRENTIQITVADTGIGISPEKQKTIFDPFTQADTSTTRNYGGTGLGLTISARLISMMGGKIKVESEPGRGSRFSFTVVLATAERALEPVGLNRSLLSGTRVLVVDDNATNRRILTEMLKRWAMEVQAAESGEEALKELIRARSVGSPYHLLLTDMHMPNMDGFGLVEQIRKRPDLPTLAIMMLTSGARHGDTERCRALGISVHLYKPVRRTELLSAVLSSLGQSVESKNQQPVASDKPVASAFLNVLLAEDNQVNQRVATRILEKMGHRVTVANNGVEALALLESGGFDLALMDIQMPQMDGFAATQHIRKRETNTHHHLPIIAMTAHAMKGDRERCLEGGMDGYVSKPISAAALEAAILNVVPRMSQGTGKRVELAAPRAPSPAPQFNRAQTLERLGQDEELLQEVLAIFLDQTPKHMATLRSALAAGDAGTVERTAHSMKGELGYLGLAEIMQKAKELEESGRHSDLDGASRLFSSFEKDISGVLAAVEKAKAPQSRAASSGGSE